MPKYHIWTIGCQMNRAESERLGSRFEELGYEPVRDITQADLVVLNTCVVRQSAENRVVNKLHALRALKKTRPDIKLALTGCYVNSDIMQMTGDHPFVDCFFKPGDPPPWLETPTTPSLPQKPSVSTYVTISQGCNNFCSYCIVPYRRGREKSRTPDEITCEAKELVRRGAKEIILLGQNVDSYGHDLSEKPDLADLLTELDGIEGLARLRFLTNHPKDMSTKLIDAIASLDKVCEQINLPVQAGSNEILKKMNRGYTIEHYRRLVKKIRDRVPGIAISTDIITGFPTETENQFRETFNLLNETNFDTVHIAAYSPRAGTKAAGVLKDDVPAEVKKSRLAALENLQERIQTEINSRLRGETVEILVEGEIRDKWHGRTRTDKPVFFKSDRDYQGQRVNVTITKTSPWSLQGEAVAGKGNQEEK